MNKENTTYLFEHYPKLFPQKSREEGPMRTLMVFGFECGDGWFNLLNSLCAIIQEYIDMKQDPESLDYEEKYPQIEVLQVKEKFGGLRFYTSLYTDEITHFIDTASSMSYHTCIRCGNTKNVELTKGWIEPICENCKNE